MNCKEVTDFLADYLDGSLPSRQRFLMTLHLLLCRDCRRYLKSYATTIKLAHAMGQAVPDDEAPIPKELVEAILTARGRAN